MLKRNNLYQGDISSDNFQKEIYFGISQKQDIQTIKNLSTMKKTKMIRDYRIYSGKLKLPKKNKLEWKILRQHQPYNVNTKSCPLCLNGKVQIAFYRGNNMLTKRTEMQAQETRIGK